MFHFQIQIQTSIFKRRKKVFENDVSDIDYRCRSALVKKIERVLTLQARDLKFPAIQIDATLTKLTAPKRWKEMKLLNRPLKGKQSDPP